MTKDILTPEEVDAFEDQVDYFHNLESRDLARLFTSHRAQTEKLDHMSGVIQAFTKQLECDRTPASGDDKHILRTINRWVAPPASEPPPDHEDFLAAQKEGFKAIRKGLDKRRKASEPTCPSCGGTKTKPGKVWPTQGDQLERICGSPFHDTPDSESPLDEASQRIGGLALKAMRDNPDHDTFCLLCEQSFKKELGHPCSVEPTPSEDRCNKCGGPLCTCDYMDMTTRAESDARVEKAREDQDRAWWAKWSKAENEANARVNTADALGFRRGFLAGQERGNKAEQTYVDINREEG